jgi:hypothetical protein
MFHVEHAKNQKSAKNQILRIFGFLRKNKKKTKKMLDFLKFLARGRQ